MPRKDPEATRAYNRVYLQVNIDRLRVYKREWARQWRKANPEKARQKDREKRRANPERIRASNQKRYYANPEKARQAAKAYQRAHAEEVKARSKAYRTAHPEKHRADEKRRRARHYAAPVRDLTHTQWLDIQTAQGHRCAYCGKRCKGHLTQDHITPLSQGGGHTMHNVIGACRNCNSKKQAGPPLSPVQPLLL